MSNPKTNIYGNKHWFNNQLQLHREDGPAVECANGDKEWWLNDKLHREDGPAVEHASGYKEWYLNGKLHREDGPAIEWIDGCKCWYLNGKEVKESDVIKPPMVKLGKSPTSGLLKDLVKRRTK